ncbi:LacI family DNA-binding transcriptional regulator [Actinomadura sp. 6N118]|uniref:LacI family DNA-binding transcriptional regulator n=1 Tax=Actinomadura sp. 6N118 TaxID=3375151 RepID=UPI00379134BA
MTQDDVATRAGVSRALVSLVMRNSPQVSETRRKAVLRAAAELGYRPNAYAAQLASRQTMTLGVVLVELENPVFPAIFSGVEHQAEEAGYAVLLTAGDLDQELERRAVNRLLGHRVDGIILVGTRLPSSELRDLADQVPLVVVGRRVTGVDTVSVDDRQGARVAVEHLLSLGHEDIAHIDGGNGPGARIRRRSYTDTMESHGMSARIRTAGGDYTEQGGRAAAETLLSSPHPPTAIFAANDLSALGVLAGAKRRGMSVPDDLSLVGFDNTTLSAFGYISLTTVNQPGHDMGVAAVNSVTVRIDDTSRRPRTILLAPELVVRSTTAPAAATQRT